MMNKERVKEEFRLALDDQKYGRELDTRGSFYRSDYIGKELMVSFVAGTVCYGLFLMLYVLAKMEALPDQVASVDYAGLGILLAVSYVIFIAVYMLVTGLIYTIRYRRTEKIASEYTARLRRIENMYEQEHTEE